MRVEDVLSSDPEVVSGEVVFKGTRVPVAVLFDYLAAGDPLAAFLEDFPTVQKDQAEAAILLAVDRIKVNFFANSSLEAGDAA